MIDADADARSFSTWIEPHWLAMHRLSQRLCGPDGDDVLQEALAAAWRKRMQYEADRGQPRAWLLAIVADQARKQRARRRPSFASGEVAKEASVDQVSERRVDLARAIQRLSQRQQLAVALFYYVDLPVTEVAAAMGCSEGTVKSTLAEGRARLRQLLGKEY